MIAAHGMKPRLINPIQSHFRIRPTIDKIADREQSIFGAVESDIVENGLQREKVTVNIANGEVSTYGIALEVLYETHHISPLGAANQHPVIGAVRVGAERLDHLVHALLGHF